MPEVKRLHEPKGSAAGLSLSPRDDAHIDCCLNSLTLISISAYPKVTREQVCVTSDSTDLCWFDCCTLFLTVFNVC